jgi:hypothetical protein
MQPVRRARGFGAKRIRRGSGKANSANLPGRTSGRLRCSLAARPQSDEPDAGERAPIVCGCDERARKLRPQLAAAWWRANDGWVLEQEHGLPPVDRPRLRYTVTRLIDEKAWRAAQQLACDPGCGAQVALTAAELQSLTEGPGR